MITSNLSQLPEAVKCRSFIFQDSGEVFTHPGVTKPTRGEIPVVFRHRYQYYESVWGILHQLKAFKTGMSDIFERRAAGLGLPPRLPSFSSDTTILPFIDDKSDNACLQLCLLLSYKIGDWFCQMSAEGMIFDHHDFEGSADIAIPALQDCLLALREGSPKPETNWETSYLVLCLFNVVCGAAKQKCYVEEILKPSGELHEYMSLLASLLDLPAIGAPKNNLWVIDYSMSMFSALLVGIDWSNSIYHSPIDAALLAPIEPISAKIIEIVAENTPLERFHDSETLSDFLAKFHEARLTGRARDSDAVDNIIKCFRNWIVSKTQPNVLGGIVRAKKLFPSLVLMPLGEIARHYKQEVLNFQDFYDSSGRGHFASILSQCGSDVYAQIVDFIEEESH